MNKNTKKILTLSVLGLFMFAFAMSFVVAAPETTVATGNAIQDPIKDLFTEWEGGQMTTNVAKYLFLALLAIIIYSLSSVLPFLSDQSDWIKWPFAIVVGFLATAFITPEEVYMMLVSYGAMGLVMSAVIPLMILIFFTIEIERKNARAGAIMTPVVWIGFIGFIIYKLILGWADDSNPLGSAEAITYFVVMLISVAFIFYKDKILHKIWKKGVTAGMQEKGKANEATLAARITEKKRLLAELVASGKGTKSHAYLALKGEIEGLEKHLASE